MVAEDHAGSRANAKAIYECIRQPLVSPNVSSDRKLPLVYVIDSILKNVRGKFIPIIEEDAKNWIPIVFDALSETSRAKLKKVWNLWKDSGVFKESSWKEMGSCFGSDGASSGAGSGQSSADSSGLSAKLKLAGITISVRVAFFSGLATLRTSCSMRIFFQFEYNRYHTSERWKLNHQTIVAKGYAADIG